MPKAISVLLAFLLVAASACPGLTADTPTEKSKQTRQGKYLTAAEAYALYSKEGGKVAIIDVRTPEEYVFVGHPTMAVNIPIMLWSGTFDPQKKRYPLAENKAFVAAVAAKYGKDATLLVMCRSGDRSAKAANVLAEAGYNNVESIVDGFEGDKVTDKNDPHFGQRTKNGWKNAGNPWTYDLDEKLVYQQAQPH